MASTRKTLFTKPAWASKSTSAPSVRPLHLTDASIDSDGDDGDDGNTTNASIFGQKHIYQDIVAQERRRREKHAQRAQDRKQKGNRQNLDSDKQKSVKVGSTKRRRISDDSENEEEDGSDQPSDDSRGADTDQEETISPAAPKTALPSTNARSQGQRPAGDLGLHPTRKSRRQMRDGGADVISLDDDDSKDEKNDPLFKEANSTVGSSELKRQTTHGNVQQLQTQSDPESEEDDEYLRDLKRRAREEARLKKLGVALNKAPSPPGDKENVPLAKRAASLEAAVTLVEEDAPSMGMDNSGVAQDDPEIQILIDTMIPNAKKLVVSRRASQPLDKVKEFWCQRNGLPPVIASKVFLTWNGTRLYNSSTARGIIEILKKTYPMRDGSDPSNGKIKLEAMTEEILEYRQQQQERRRKEAEARARGDNLAKDEASNEQDGGTKEASNEALEVEKPGIVIRLHCPGVEDMNMRVRSNTPVSRIITAFRHQRNIDSNKQCWLSYDGDRLETDQTVEEVGLEHEDTVDVYLR